MGKRDYYDVLGVSRSATEGEIKKAYRRLARKYHPDVTGNDKAAAEKFKEVQEAYDVLNDPEKRKVYDQFGHAGTGGGGGAPGGGGAWRSYTWKSGVPNGGGFDFSDLFGGMGGGRRGRGSMGIEDLFEQFARRGQGGYGGGEYEEEVRGEDIQHSVQIGFEEAVRGTTREIVTAVQQSDGGRRQERLSVKIPAGIADGGKIRLRGKGQPGPGGNSGDLILTVRVAEHPYYTREGKDLVLEAPLTFEEAAVGTKIEVPTLQGPTMVTIPPGSSSGRKLRLRGKGIEHKDGTKGDLYLKLKIVPPAALDEESKDLLRKFTERNPQKDIRSKFKS